MRTIEQRRAAHALKRINELNAQEAEFKSRYRSYVDRLGPAILMNGLGQALAAEQAAAGEKPSSADQRAHHELYAGLSKWLCDPVQGIYRGHSNLLQALMENDQRLYLRAQTEALAWLQWHKKCCRACFPKAEEGDG